MNSGNCVDWADNQNKEICNGRNWWCTGALVFPVRLAGNRLIQATHEPVDAGEPLSPDVGNVRNARAFKGFDVFATAVVLNQQRSFEQGAPPVHDLVLAEVH